MRMRQAKEVTFLNKGVTRHELILIADFVKIAPRLAS